jgi:hypothetical protein
MLPCGTDEVTIRATSGRRASVADSLATSDDERERRNSLHMQHCKRQGSHHKHRYKAPRQRGLSPHLRVKITEAEEQCFAGGTEGTSPWRSTPGRSPSLPSSSTSRLTPLGRAAAASNELHVPAEAVIPAVMPHDAPRIAAEPSPLDQSAPEVISRQRQWADSTETDTAGEAVDTRAEETQATSAPRDSNAGAGDREAANIGGEPGKTGRKAVSKPRLTFSESSKAPNDDASQQEALNPQGGDGLKMMRSAFRKRVSVRTRAVCVEAPRLEWIFACESKY